MTFKELGLHDKLLEAISYMGFETPTPIQEKTIPIILNGDDLIACAQTGTGKTAAFMLPILEMLSGKRYPFISTLVIAPTRELAIQIDKQIEAYGYFTDVHSYAVYGGGAGQDWEDQKSALKKGADIIVATPGKLISHLNLGYVDFSKIKYLILDEADRMLDMGFYDDIKQITKYLPEKRQTLLFSATMPPNIRKLSKKILVNPKEISFDISKPAEGILQAAYYAYDHQKTALIHKLITNKPKYNSILIFSSTRKKVTEIARSLKQKKMNVEWISSDLDQKEREQVLGRFRSKVTRILIATDVISRGIDITDIQLIINYDVPKDAEDYVHRVGRTARASTTGLALSFINEDDIRKFKQIEQLIEKEIMKIPLPSSIGKGPDPSSSRSRSNYKRGKPKKYSRNKR